ncbi:MAG: hypothetical protein Q7Q71_15600 [Verrucomicrobiota bacterium JB023]|nr:hypothetical protein [Verrucomicrobiota bacterium JB023]
MAARTTLALLPFLLLPTSLLAELRNWRSSDGAKTLSAEFISRDDTSITLRNAAGRVLTFSLEKLHVDDKKFIESSYPHRPAVNEAPPAGNAFDTLEFGDDRETVEAKLMESQIVECSVEESFFGRTGLNGVFKTKNTIGGLHCYLYFDWTPGGNLREVTLQTESQQALEYRGRMRSNWGELVDLLNKLYGRPVSEAPYPERKDLQEGLMLASHLWRTDEGHSVLLGTGQEHEGYTVNVRFTTKRLNPIPISAPGQ